MEMDDWNEGKLDLLSHLIHVQFYEINYFVQSYGDTSGNQFIFDKSIGVPFHFPVMFS